MLNNLIAIELQILFKEVINSLKKWKYRFAYLIFLVTLISIHFGLKLFFNFIQLDKYPLTLYFQNEINNIQTLFFIWIIYSLLKGYQYNDLIKIFNISDETILLPSSIQSNNIYLAKFIKNTCIHLFYLLFFFITIHPIFTYLNIKTFHIVILFISFLFIIEINYLINYTVKLLYINKKNIQIYFLIIIIILIYVLNRTIKPNNILFNFPINILYHIITNSNEYVKISTNLLFLITIFFSLLYYSYKNAYNYYEEISIIKKTIQNDSPNFPLIKKLKNINSLEMQLFRKDLIIIQRTNGKKLLIDIILNYLLAYIIVINIKANDILNDLMMKELLFYVTPFIIILLINIRSNFLTQLYDEWDSLWFLKTTNITIDKIINSKIIFGYIYNIVFNHPFLIMLFIYLGYNGIYISIILINIILTDIYIKLYLSYYFNMKTNIFINEFLKSFIHMLIEFLLIGLYLFLYRTNIEYMYVYTILVISLIITKYDVPVKYYLLELLVNYYFLGIISIIFISISMISLNIFFYTEDYSFIIYKTVWHSMTILASSIFLKEIMRNFIKNNMIKTDM